MSIEKLVLLLSILGSVSQIGHFPGYALLLALCIVVVFFFCKKEHEVIGHAEKFRLITSRIRGPCFLHVCAGSHVWTDKTKSCALRHNQAALLRALTTPCTSSGDQFISDSSVLCFAVSDGCVKIHLTCLHPENGLGKMPPKLNFLWIPTVGGSGFFFMQLLGYAVVRVSNCTCCTC